MTTNAIEFSNTNIRRLYERNVNDVASQSINLICVFFPRVIKSKSQFERANEQERRCRPMGSMKERHSGENWQRNEKKKNNNFKTEQKETDEPLSSDRSKYLSPFFFYEEKERKRNSSDVTHGPETKPNEFIFQTTKLPITTFITHWNPLSLGLTHEHGLEPNVTHFNLLEPVKKPSQSIVTHNNPVSPNGNQDKS